MKTRDLLELFISGGIIYENVSKVTVDEDNDMRWLVGAVDAKDVRNGNYLVYYEPIETGYDKYVQPDYTLHDEDGTAIYLLRIDDDNMLELNDGERQTLKNVLHAAYKTFRRYPGMNTGKSEIHNLWYDDITTIINIHDRL